MILKKRNTHYFEKLIALIYFFGLIFFWGSYGWMEYLVLKIVALILFMVWGIYYWKNGRISKKELESLEEITLQKMERWDKHVLGLDIFLFFSLLSMLVVEAVENSSYISIIGLIVTFIIGGYKIRDYFSGNYKTIESLFLTKEQIIFYALDDKVIDIKSIKSIEVENECLYVFGPDCRILFILKQINEGNPAIFLSALAEISNKKIEYKTENDAKIYQI